MTNRRRCIKQEAPAVRSGLFLLPGIGLGHDVMSGYVVSIAYIYVIHVPLDDELMCTKFGYLECTGHFNVHHVPNAEAREAQYLPLIRVGALEMTASLIARPAIPAKTGIIEKGHRYLVRHRIVTSSSSSPIPQRSQSGFLL